MNYIPERIEVPAWISCRTYLFGKPDSRTYISNEKNHKYVMLDGLASDMWQLLYDRVSESDFTVWVKNNGVEKEVDGFLRELVEQELITVSDKNEAEREKTTAYEPFGADSESDAEAKFIEEMQAWLFEKKFMSSLFFELTYRCNLKCVHCYNPKNMPEVELDFDLCKKAIDDAYELGCFRITFSGGEATLHSRFIELVRYARSKHISVEIFTNGQILAENDRLYREMLALYPYRVCVSLYGTTKQTHECVTSVDGSFEKSKDLIFRLRKENVNVQIKNFLLNLNCRECLNVKKMAADIGATSVADISLIPTIEGDKKTFRYMLDEKTLFGLYIDSESPLYVGTDYKPLDYEKRKNDSPCFGGFSGLCVNPDGEVVICVSMPLSVGNLKKTTLKEIWQAAAEKNPESKLYLWQKVRIADFGECHKEEYCAFCDFCPGMGYLENGFLKKSDVLCMQAKTKMKAYKYLKMKSEFYKRLHLFLKSMLEKIVRKANAISSESNDFFKKIEELSDDLQHLSDHAIHEIEDLSAD